MNPNGVQINMANMSQGNGKILLKPTIQLDNYCYLIF